MPIQGSGQSGGRGLLNLTTKRKMRNHAQDAFYRNSKTPKVLHSKDFRGFLVVRLTGVEWAFFLFMIFYYISQSLVSQRIQGIYLFSQLSFFDSFS